MPSNEELNILAILNRVFAIQSTGRVTRFADPVNGSESYDGTSPAKAKLLGQSAITSAGKYGAVVLLPGTYSENLVVANSNVWLMGATYDGAQKTSVSPAAGVALELQNGLCKVSDMYLSSGNDHVLKATGPKHEFSNLAIEVLSAGKTGLWLNDADYATLSKLYLNGGNRNNVIGVLFGSGTVSGSITESTILNFGDPLGGGANNGYGIAMHALAQRINVLRNFIASNAYGVYCYTTGGSATWHAIHANENYLNRLYDIYSPDAATDTGIRPDGNFYAYTGWYEDVRHSGIAEKVVPCGDDATDPLLDWAPLTHPESWRYTHAPRNR
jgi:hypothetical protein